MVHICIECGLDLNEVMDARVWWMRAWTELEEQLLINE